MNRRRAIWGIALLGGTGVVAGSLVWLPRFRTPDLAFLVAQKPLLAALAETILPATDTPGAIEAGVPDYLMMQLLRNSTPVVQNQFIAGLKSVERHCLDHYDQSFVRCSREQQNAVMRLVEAEGQPWSGVMGKVQRKLVGDSFFTLLKSYTCMGYYTSRLGTTRGLAYSAVPGRFIGCQSMRIGQKSWATK